MADNTGPAFPLADSSIDLENSNLSAANGMTLRDYFAAKAMQGMQANPCDEAFGMTVDEHASYAYKMADAMLAAAERKGGES